MSFEIVRRFMPPLRVGIICRCPRLEMYCGAREIDMTTLRLLRPPLLFISLDMIHRQCFKSLYEDKFKFEIFVN